MDKDERITPEQTVSWTYWPLRQEPLRALGVGLLLVGFCAYCLFAFNHWLYAVAALVILTLGAHTSVLPSAYSVEPTGIRLKHLLTARVVPWDRLACYLRTDEFIALSTANPPTHRSISEGMIVRLAGNGDRVEKAIARHLPEYQVAAHTSGKRK